MQNGVILNKLQTVDELLNELKSLGKVTVSQLEEDWMKRKAIERNLQVLCEVLINICQRIISLSDQVPATSGTDAIHRCVSLGVLKSETPYKKMAQFRYFIVHRYERIDSEILVDIVNLRIGDFVQFRKEIMEYVTN